MLENLLSLRFKRHEQQHGKHKCCMCRLQSSTSRLTVEFDVWSCYRAILPSRGSSDFKHLLQVSFGLARGTET